MGDGLAGRNAPKRKKRARALCGAEKRVLLVGLAPCAQAGAGAAVSGRSAVLTGRERTGDVSGRVDCQPQEASKGAKRGRFFSRRPTGGVGRGA